MKKSILILFVLFLCVSVANAQRAKIETKAVTPHMQETNTAFAQDSTIASGLTNVANKTWCYVDVVNIDGSATITGATWSILTKPSGSSATISSISGMNWWAKFRPDVKGTYEIRVVMNTSSGSHDTTIKIYSADFVGVGNFQGVPAQYPNCMSCHQGMQEFVNIFNKWKESGHANMFRYNIDSGSTHYSSSCFPCHTVGHDHNLTVDNHGFDDVAATLGWIWYGPPAPGKWDSLKTNFPSLVAFATIGCENCHGPGSEHTAGGDTNKISISYKADMCGQCHDSPTHHIKNYQFNQAAHSEAVWSNSFAQNSGAPGFEFNSLNNCIRCHDAKGYINFTNGVGTNTVGMIEAQHEFITCQACHDPHGGPNDHQLRFGPSSADTLANGYHYTGVGYGRVCLSCHKSRRDNVAYTQGRVNSSHWGPHHSPQGDVLLGQNAATFGQPPYLTYSHKNIQNLCIQCHMAPTADTSSQAHNKVGEHTFKMENEQYNYDNVNGCLSCHPGVTSFEDFIAPQDFDGDTQIEPWEDEIEGCLQNMRIALPPSGIDSVSWQLIAADSFNVNLRKSYWNYLLLEDDQSHGFHNPFFYIGVYQRTMGIIGVSPISSEVPTVYSLSQNYPNPFNPTTKINFSLPKQENVSIKIYDIMGRLVYTLVNQKMQPGRYETIWTSINNNGNTVASGVYFYRIEAGSFVESKKMILVR